MAPVNFSMEIGEALGVIEQVIADAGGKVTNTSGDRVDATFRTPLLRFTDDVSFLLDDQTKLMHFRSASRVGHSDLGANRKRLNALVPKIASAIG